MSEKLDPEDVKALAHRCAQRMSAEVRRFGGSVLQVAGDQIMAVFGAPTSHEDDAERAVRAALAIRNCKLADDAQQAIEVHVGVNTGEAATGLVGPSETSIYTVMGDPVNTAARLMSAAPPGSVLVGEETFRATRHALVYRELPPLVVKGKERPLKVWECVAVSSQGRPRPKGGVSLVGRDEELRILSEIRFKVVRGRRPQLVSILGEPGIGKSRLVDEFERRILAETDCLVIHGRCMPYGEALGSWALAQALKEAASITAEDDSGSGAAKLSQLISHTFGADESYRNELDVTTQHLLILSGLQGGGAPAKMVDQASLHHSVRRFFQGLASSRPLCVVFEDIHWADASLLDLIEFLGARVKESPLLVMTQARPELLDKRANWGGGLRTFTSLPLEPLPEDASKALIQNLCREHEIPTEMADRVGKGAGGNPLFAEELVAMIAERGAGAGIPSAIKALISARLDGLPPSARKLLQIASVFGKSFWNNGVADASGGDVESILEDLVVKDFLRLQPRSEFRGGVEYEFKHDLIRDVAYEMLSKGERRSLHARIGHWLRTESGEQLESYLDQLAHHALAAGDDRLALDYLIRAADRARRTAAHRQEARLLTDAINLCSRADRHDLFPELHLARGKAWHHLNLWKEALSDLQRVIELDADDQSLRHAEISILLASICFWTFDIPLCRKYAAKALEIAEQTNRDDLAAIAIGWIGSAEQCDHGLHNSEPIFRRALSRDANTPSVPMALFALNLYLQGKAVSAAQVAEDALRRYQGINDTSNTMFGYPHLALALVSSGRYAEGLAVFAEAEKFGRDYEVKSFLARSIAMSAGVHLELGSYEEHEAVCGLASELSRKGEFMPTFVSSGIDLLLNFARRDLPDRAEDLVGSIEEVMMKTAGWHGWLWNIRMAQAKAEIAFAKKDWERALHYSRDSATRSFQRGRLKYQVLGLWTQSRVLQQLGQTREAISLLREATTLARPSGDPAMFLRPVSLLLMLDGDDALCSEARLVRASVISAVPHEALRNAFAHSPHFQVPG